MQTKQKFFLLCLTLSLCLSLSACVAPIIMATAAGGTVVYMKSNKFKTFYTDSDITNRAVLKIKNDAQLKNTRILIAAKNQNVLMVGQVAYASQRIEAQQLVSQLAGVQQVYNELTVSGPTSPLTQTSDSWITTKIKSLFLESKGLHSNAIKIVTENGVVYLMGNVSQSQALQATQIASHVSGVQKVVQLFNVNS